MAQARNVELYVEGLNDVLRAISRLPKEAQNELRGASAEIARSDMAPAWRNAALYYAGPWGSRIADSVRVKRDRVPAVSIGYAKRVFSGGASSIMVRFPADKGRQGKSGNRVPEAFGEGSDWISRVRGYQPEAMRKWGRAVDDIVRKWSAL
jgi:hypothetical protein